MREQKPAWLDYVNDKYQNELLELRRERLAQLDLDQYETMKEAVNLLPQVQPIERIYNQDVIEFSGPIDETQKLQLRRSLEAFIPWRKGPFKFYDYEIDSEWRSQLKWKRFEKHLGSLKGQVIADIGCNNGYFMFRTLAFEPTMVLGLEPVVKNYLNFQLIQHFAQERRLHFELFGMEHLDLLPDSFDTIFCLGILYHHTDPIGLLRKARAALKKGGRLIIDCQGIPGDKPYALVPPGRYAGGRGFWFLPTLSCLQNWVRRSGFQHIETVFAEALDPEEQRSTDWAPVKSLGDFLSADGSQTIEGHPAPHRFYLIAKV